MTQRILMGMMVIPAVVSLWGNLCAGEPGESVLDGLRWHFSGMDGVTAGSGESAGVPFLSITVPDSIAPEWPRYVHALEDLTPGSLIALEALVSSPVTRNGAGAYVTIEFHDAAGQRIAVQQSEMCSNASGWQQVEALAAVPEGAVSGTLCLVFNGIGEGRFARPRLAITPPEPPALEGKNIRITVSSSAVGTLIGLGFEDDGWFYTRENRDKGVEEADWAVRETRIAWMEPDLVRMFFWYRDWNPSGDWKTFDFDTDNMRSHYRSLEIYQRLGCPVIVTGVEWGMNNPYGDPAAVSTAIGALLEHLVRERGFTCIRYWTLTNEPNGYFMRKGYDLDRYKILHRLVAAQIRHRGLEVGIVGSDDAMGAVWFRQCVEDPEYLNLCGLMASHLYVQHSGGNRIMRHHLTNRLTVLKHRSPEKAFAVTEFGFQDHRSTVNLNPLMESYDYALWTMEFAIDALSRGVRGLSIWCLQDLWYPRLFMGYGLWRFKDENWRPKPVYYAWAALTRLTRAGDPVYPCETVPEGALRAVGVGGRVIFWVNPVNRAYTVELAALSPAQDLATPLSENSEATPPAIGGTAYLYEEHRLEGDQYAGQAVPLAAGSFEAPPRSFGWIMLDSTPDHASRYTEASHEQ